MRVAVVSVCLAICMGAGILLFAADPISGKWVGEWGPNPAERNQVVADLKYDGKTLTGTFNSGSSAATISKGSFNEKTGAVHLEAEAKGRDGTSIHYVVDGKLDKNKIAGTWKYANGNGDFAITKQ